MSNLRESFNFQIKITNSFNNYIIWMGKFSPSNKVFLLLSNKRFMIKFGLNKKKKYSLIYWANNNK